MAAADTGEDATGPLSGSDGEMVAAYAVSVVGIERTKADLAKVGLAIRALRQAKYSVNADQSVTTVSQARFGTRSERIVGRNSDGGNDIFAARVDVLEGNTQSAAEKAMAKAMAEGKRAQTTVLRAAVTTTGQSGKGRNKGGRKGPGRDDTGALIAALATNVESQKFSAGVTKIVGWHGWGRARPGYAIYQEQGSKGRKSSQLSGSITRKVKRRAEGVTGKGVQATNSLGASIIAARKVLQVELGKLKK